MLFFIEFETVVFVVNVSNYYPDRLTSVSKVKKRRAFRKTLLSPYSFASATTPVFSRGILRLGGCCIAFCLVSHLCECLAEFFGSCLLLLIHNCQFLCFEVEYQIFYAFFERDCFLYLSLATFAMHIRYEVHHFRLSCFCVSLPLLCVNRCQSDQQGYYNK